MGENDFTLYLTEKQLNNRGYSNVTVFSDCKACIHELDKNPDVIFVDATVCEKNFSAGINQIKRINPGVYLVLLSEGAQPISSDKLQELGVFECIKHDWDEVVEMESVLLKIAGIKAFLKNASFYL